MFSFLLTAFIFSLLAAIVTFAGTGYALAHYRDRFDKQEQKVAGAIGISVGLLSLAMLTAGHTVPGTIRELTYTTIAAGILAVTAVIVWRLLSIPSQER